MGALSGGVGGEMKIEFESRPATLVLFEHLFDGSVFRVKVCPTGWGDVFMKTGIDTAWNLSEAEEADFNDGLCKVVEYDGTLTLRERKGE